MTAYTPTTGLAKAMLKLHRMVALSAAFQQKIGGDYSAACDRVLFEGVPDKELAEVEGIAEITDDKCFASIWINASGARAVSDGSQVDLRDHAELHLYLRTPVNPAMTTWNDRRLEAVDVLETWTQEILLLSGADDQEPVIEGEGHLAISSVIVPMHGHSPRKTRESTGDFFYRHMLVSYGDAVIGGA